MKSFSSNRYNLRFLKTETVATLNKLAKLNKTETLNKILNDCIELGASLLLDETSLSSETFADKLEKNTRKVTSKLNRMESLIKKQSFKILTMQTVQEAMMSSLINTKLVELTAKNSPITEDTLASFAEDLPPFANKIKENLLTQLFGGDAEEGESE